MVPSLLSLAVLCSAAPQAKLDEPAPSIGSPRGNPEFHGSMLMEIPFERIDVLKDGGTLEFEHFGGGVCDDTSISFMQVTKHLKRHGQVIQLEMAFFINVRPSFDRAVSLYLTLMDGARLGPKMALTSIKAAEKRGTWGRGTWELEADEFNALYANGHTPTLKILMRVVNNE